MPKSQPQSTRIDVYKEWAESWMEVTFDKADKAVTDKAVIAQI